jgi:hypothetical protein
MGHQQLPQFCKTHDTQRNIYTVAPCILKSQGDEKIFWKKWARLIQKIGAGPGEGREGRSEFLYKISFRQMNRPKGEQISQEGEISSNKGLSDQAVFYKRIFIMKPPF